VERKCSGKIVLVVQKRIVLVENTGATLLSKVQQPSLPAACRSTKGEREGVARLDPDYLTVRRYPERTKQQTELTQQLASSDLDHDHVWVEQEPPST
jgi:hypothetical protein